LEIYGEIGIQTLTLPSPSGRGNEKENEFFFNIAEDMGYLASLFFSPFSHS
jgi:hypothetical protein